MLVITEYLNGSILAREIWLSAAKAFVHPEMGVVNLLPLCIHYCMLPCANTLVWCALFHLTSCFLTEVVKRKDFVDGLPARPRTIRTICREDLYSDMMKLFGDPDSTNFFPFVVRFTDEEGVDTGGLSREAFSTFWEAAYNEHFDGANIVAPVVRAGQFSTSLQTLGRILSYGYISSGFLPVRVAFPTLASILVSGDIPAEILVQSFKDSLTPVDLCTMKEGFASHGKKFPKDLLYKLISIFSRFDCLEVPNPKNLLRLCEQSCRFSFVDKPFSSIMEIKRGIPPQHISFWEEKGVIGLNQVYLALAVSPMKILNCIEEPFFYNRSEERVFHYLVEYIGRMKVEEVQVFLRFCTGSSVCIDKPITIEFNGLSGLERRPIAHTCSCMLELPRTYINYSDFSKEFQIVMDSENNGWKMDTI